MAFFLLFSEFMTQVNAAVAKDQSQANQVLARAELNTFIVEQDRP